VLSRGRIVVEDGGLVATRGSGQFLPCALSQAAKPLGVPVPELAAFAESAVGLV
jgi:dihydropyrimidinase